MRGADYSVGAFGAEEKLRRDAIGGSGFDLLPDDNEVAWFKDAVGDFPVPEFAVANAALLVEES